MNALSSRKNILLINIWTATILLVLCGSPVGFSQDLTDCHSYTYWRITGTVTGDEALLFTMLNNDYKEVTDDVFQRGDIILFGISYQSNGQINRASHSGYFEDRRPISHLRKTMRQDWDDTRGQTTEPSSISESIYRTVKNLPTPEEKYLKGRSDTYPIPLDEINNNNYLDKNNHFIKTKYLEEADEKIKNGIPIDKDLLIKEIDEYIDTYQWGRLFEREDKSQIPAIAARFGATDWKVFRKKEPLKSFSIESISPKKQTRGTLQIVHSEGNQVQFKASVLYDGDISPKDVTGEVEWIPDIIDQNGKLKDPSKVGTTTIIAANFMHGFSKVPSSNQITLVIERELARIQIESIPKENAAGEVRISEGGDVQFKATAHFTDGATEDGYADRVAWPSPLDNLGRATSLAKGEYTITAEYIQKGTALPCNPIKLIVEDPVTSLEITPVSPSNLVSGQVIVPHTRTTAPQFKATADGTDAEVTNKVKWSEPFINNNSEWNTRRPRPGAYTITAEYRQDNRVISSTNSYTLNIIEPLLTVTRTAVVIPTPVGADASSHYVTLDYTIVNAGTCEMTNVVLTDPLPSGMTIRSISCDPGATCSQSGQNELKCSVQSMASRSNIGIKVELESKQTGVFTNTVHLQGQDPLGVDFITSTTATITITGAPPAAGAFIVPEVEGKLLNTATTDITTAGLSVGEVFRENHDDVPAGHVIRQYPRSGTQLNAGDPVDLDVSLGPAQRRARTLFIDPPTATLEIGEIIQFEAYIWYEDGSEDTVTAVAVWTGARQGLFTADSSGRFAITATFGAFSGSATVNVRLAFPQSWEPAISSAEDTLADVPLPPADAYTWYVMCEKNTGDVVYGEYPDPITQHIMAGPFEGPRTTLKWILDNCPRWRCTPDGECAVEPTITSEGEWYVLCDRTSGEVTLSKTPDFSRHIIMAQNLFGEPEARYWVELNCPNWRCTQDGQCATEPARGGEWKVLCDKKSGEITLSKEWDPTQHIIMDEGFLGEPDARAWVESNCPTWRCTVDGRPALGVQMGGDWYVYCAGDGEIQIGHGSPGPHLQRVMKDGFRGEQDARLWVNQNCPSWRCDANCQCIYDLASTINQLGNEETGDICNSAIIASIRSLIEGGISRSFEIYGDFMTSYYKTANEIHDQNINPSENELIANIVFNNMEMHIANHQDVVSQIEDDYADLIYRSELCPNVQIDLSNLMGNRNEVVGRQEDMNSKLNELRSELRRYGGDLEEMREDGQSITRNEGDLDFFQDGGLDEDIQDGVDNDADGFRDEDPASSVGTNVSILVYDSGDKKDDIFQLLVDGISKGFTKKGKGNLFKMSLDPGPHTATVITIHDEYPRGTCTIIIKEGKNLPFEQQTNIISDSANISLGSSASWGFVVTAPK